MFSDQANPPTLWPAPANAKKANEPAASATVAKTRRLRFIFFKVVGPRLGRVAKTVSGGGKLPI